MIIYFPRLKFNPILSNPDFFFPSFHVSFNLMSRDIDIISADRSISDDLAIFVMSKDFLNWKWRVLWHHSLCRNIFWGFSMFYQIFLSAQVKRWAIITYKHGIYELPLELPNDLRLRKLGNIRKVSKFYRMIV